MITHNIVASAALLLIGAAADPSRPLCNRLDAMGAAEKQAWLNNLAGRTLDGYQETSDPEVRACVLDTTHKWIGGIDQLCESSGEAGDFMAGFYVGQELLRNLDICVLTRPRKP